MHVRKLTKHVLIGTIGKTEIHCDCWPDPGATKLSVTAHGTLIFETREAADELIDLIEEASDAAFGPRRP